MRHLNDRREGEVSLQFQLGQCSILIGRLKLPDVPDPSEQALDSRYSTMNLYREAEIDSTGEFITRYQPVEEGIQCIHGFDSRSF